MNCEKYKPWFCEKDDVFQEGCIAALKSIDDGEYKPFQFVKVDSAMRTHIRSGLQRKGNYTDEYNEEEYGKANHNNIDLVDAISELGDKERQVILMYYYGDLSEQRIGDLLGEPRTTINSRREKALRRLNEILS